jgi:hypothetical protein
MHEIDHGFLPVDGVSDVARFERAAAQHAHTCRWIECGLLPHECGDLMAVLRGQPCEPAADATGSAED